MDRRKTDRRDGKYGDIYVFDFQALFSILYRRRILVGLMMLVILIPGLLFALTRPTEYKAVAAVLIGDEQLTPSEIERGLSPPKFDEMTIDTQDRVLSSTGLAERTVQVLAQKGIAADGTRLEGEAAPMKRTDDMTNEERAAHLVDIRRFMSDMLIQPQARSRVINVSYTDTDPYIAADIVNTHLDEYIAYIIENRREQAKVLNEWIGQQVTILKEELRKKSQAVQDYRKEAGIMLGTNSEDLIYQQITDISQQLVPIETQKANLQARQAALDSAKSKGSIGDVLASNVVQNYKTGISAAEQELKALSANLGPNHPDVLAAKRRAAQARADLSGETATIGQSITTELAAVTSQENILRARLDELNQQAEELREKEIALAALVSDETASRTLLENFMQRFEEVKSRMDMNQSNVQIFSRAEVPTAPMGIQKPMMIIVILFLAVIFGIGSVLLLELLDRGIELPDEARKALQLRLLGVLPKTKNPLASMQGRKGSGYLEEIKRIYLAVSARSGAQTILFTSSRRGEGRSTTAVALARYMSSVGAKVVLLDTDPAASSSCADKAGVSDTPGFAELLSGHADLAKTVQRDENGLAVIASGNHAAHPADLLAGGNLERLLTTLKAQYDFVIVNAAPALATTDAEIIASHSDQVILIVERARVPKKHLKKVAEMLRQYSKDVPGVILTKNA